MIQLGTFAVLVFNIFFCFVFSCFTLGVVVGLVKFIDVAFLDDCVEEWTAKKIREWTRDA